VAAPLVRQVLECLAAGNRRDYATMSAVVRAVIGLPRGGGNAQVKKLLFSGVRKRQFMTHNDIESAKFRAKCRSKGPGVCRAERYFAGLGKINTDEKCEKQGIGIAVA
jgi:hypothetical protein